MHRRHVSHMVPLGLQAGAVAIHQVHHLAAAKLGPLLGAMQTL